MVTLTDNDHYYYTNGYGQRTIGWTGNNYYTNKLNQTRVIWINREATPASQIQRKFTFNIEELNSEQLAALQKGSMVKSLLSITCFVICCCIGCAMDQK